MKLRKQATRGMSPVDGSADVPYARGVASAAGVDGCRNGWVAAVDDGDGDIALEGFVSIEDLMTTLPSATVAIDVPIGLLAEGARICDIEAKERLGARRHSVFPAPLRPVLSCATHREACDRRRSIEGKGMSLQAWGTTAKVREVDRALHAHPAWGRRLREVHPELCFMELHGGVPARYGKKAASGRAERIELLRMAFPSLNVDELLRPPRPLACAADDVVDALVCLWTARRIQRGLAKTVPASPPSDDRGLTMEMAI